MQPEAGERLRRERLRLRDLVLMMREDQIDPAGVYVESLTQVLHRHRGAFDVPARPARPDLAIPEWLAVFWRFPKNEVASIGLVIFIDIDACAGSNAAEVVVR